jgi:hypothetical protein
MEQIRYITVNTKMSDGPYFPYLHKINLTNPLEFLTYNFQDFVADFGGYLGLLLGHSVLNFFDLAWALADRLHRSFVEKNVI